MSDDTGRHPPPVGVLIVEDDRGSREGLQMLIDGTPGYRCVRTYASVEEALEQRVTPDPDVILLDVNLPGMPGSVGVKPLREHYPGAPILMLTVYDEESRIFESICNGASGYLLKKTPPARLLEAIGEALGDGAPMSPEIARKVIRLFHRVAPPRGPEHGLSPHEIRILRFLAEGYSYQAVADRLGISINTIRNYIRAIYQKLHVHSKSQAVSKALRAGII